jgi:hypothetical protein
MRASDYESFAAALADPTAAVPRGLHSGATAAIADRFAVYRNNVHASLVDALAARFPVTCALVGEEFFRGMARAYVTRHKPRQAELVEYGRDLPAFIADFAPAASLPYLPDVAATESAWLECWAAADAPALQLAQLTGHSATTLASATLAPHPASRLCRSAWPIAAIWQAHQRPSPDLATLDWQPECVLLTRPDAQIDLQCLQAGMAELAARLLAGECIEAAADAALVIDPALDIGVALGALVNAGSFSEIHPA